jgi:Male sterility protein
MSSTIGDFYQGKHVLVFGATTFPGKVLLEKLLHSCPQIEQIYCPVNIDNKTSSINHHHTPNDIFAEIYATKLFDRVRRVDPKFQEKILPFDINCLLAASTEDDDDDDDDDDDEDEIDDEQQHDAFCRTLPDKIDVCFYMANNSIDFEHENLKQILQSNVTDLKNMLAFLKTCTKLRSIVYLSSIYANIGRHN